MKSTSLSSRRLIVGGVLVASFIVAPQLAFGGHAEVSLPGSNFEIEADSNLKVDHVDDFDWANVVETRQGDLASGAADDSFGNGTKEDTEVPSVGVGGVPPNKSDLKTFGVYLEQQNGQKYLHMFWHRVQDPSGTTNMDFEFNQSDVLSANNVTPVRTKGDLLIQYDLSKGGTAPDLFLSKWATEAADGPCEASGSYPCWGVKANLTASGTATGSINTSAIPGADADGLGPISARTFGEASIDFTAITQGQGCTRFGSAYLKSRASDSFTAALKDFIAPEDTNINTCGGITIEKVSNGGTGEFDFTTSTLPGGNFSLTTVTDGVAVSTSYPDLTPGLYDVAETVPTGWDLSSATCDNGDDPSAITLASGDDITCTFVNDVERGAILITKTRKHAADGAGDHPQEGVEFTVDGVTLTTDADGEACIDDLLFDDYVVTETVPDGYVSDDAEQTVTVSANSTCGDGNEATVDFHNTPLTDITVSVDSQVDGGTASTIDCHPVDDPVVDATTDANGDGEYTMNDLEPDTYTCVIVVDP